MQGLLIIKVSTFQWWKAILKINDQLTLLRAGKMGTSCEGLQNQLWKPSVTLLGGKSCKTKPPFADSCPLNLWQATGKIRGTSLMWRPPELHSLLKTYLQLFHTFPCQDNRLSNPELEAAGKLIAGRSVTLSNTCMALPCRVQVLLTLQRIFLPSSLLNRGMLLPLPYESGKWDTGSLNGETEVTQFGRGWN